jgi:hypothetical protein
VGKVAAEQEARLCTGGIGGIGNGDGDGIGDDGSIEGLACICVD